MSFDFKKEFKEFYLPKNRPMIVDIPTMNFVSVRGKGDPNEADGEYKRALEVLYGVSYTIKMSKMTDNKPDGYFDFVVPPLEGLWRQEGTDGIDYAHKERFEWTAMIRLPDFVTEEVFERSVREVTVKKKLDCSKAEFFTYTEGLCVQCMHIGSYDDEPATLETIKSFIGSEGYLTDISEERRHHEIYLSDPRKTAEEKLRTVIRIPVKKI